MTICREWLIHRENLAGSQARILTCRSWQCEYCQPIRRRQLMAQAASGNPTRFITLTCNPAFYSSPEERLGKLAWAWRTIVKQLRRRNGRDSIEYLAVVEATKRGEPHLHILARGTYISQDWLSVRMGELIHSPIVDIRRVKNANEAVRYVAKYITKKPAEFGTAKRYWSSRNYGEDDDYQDLDAPADIGKWHVWKNGLPALLASWWDMGIELQSCTEVTWIGAIYDPGRFRQCENPVSPPSLSVSTTGKLTGISQSTSQTSKRSKIRAGLTASPARK